MTSELSWPQGTMVHAYIIPLNGKLLITKCIPIHICILIIDKNRIINFHFCRRAVYIYLSLFLEENCLYQLFMTYFR